MLNDTIVTLQGNVGGDVAVRRVGEATVAGFRIACTPRRFRPQSQEWVDGPTQWYSVSAWRVLGEHCAESLRRGDPVLVHGRLSTHTYVNKAGVEVADLEVEALLVGHDLSRGTSAFRRTSRPQQTPHQSQSPQQPVTSPETGRAEVAA